MNNINKISRIKKVTGVLLIIILVSTLAVFTVSCKWTVGVVKGSGEIRTEERDVSNFKKVNLSGVGSLIITQGEQESLVIEADDNIIPLIEAEVIGDKLNIGFKRGYNFIPASTLKFYLTAKELDEIKLSGAGNIYCNEFSTGELEFEISGAGDIDFKINAESIVIISSGAGDITLEGSTGTQKITLSGAGKYNGAGLESKKCEISVSGAGSATVNVSEELDVDIGGVGNVSYMGKPAIKQSISGIGRIKNID